MTTESNTNAFAVQSEVCHGRMKRLSSLFYKGHTFVLWNMTIDERKTGWLDAEIAWRFREIQLHTLSRFGLMCHSYCLMPDHMHFLWCGLAESSDQNSAATFFRRHMNAVLGDRGVKFQRQPWDAVLKEKDRERDAVLRAAFYVVENPARAGLVSESRDWPYSGSQVAGYPRFDWRDADFPEKVWRIYDAEIRRLRGVSIEET
jgi:REP element-mobilizing transposase RayT